MGFRNPVTSLPADKITPGVLGPGVLASAFSPTAYGRRIDLVDPAAPTASATFMEGRAEAPNGHYTNAMHLESLGDFTGTRAMIDLQGYYDQFNGAKLWLTAEEGQIWLSGAAHDLVTDQPVGVRLTGGVIVDDALTLAGFPVRAILTGTVTLPSPTTSLKTLSAIPYTADSHNFGSVRPIMLPIIDITTGAVVTWGIAVNQTATTFAIRYTASAAVGADRTVQWIGIVP